MCEVQESGQCILKAVSRLVLLSVLFLSLKSKASSYSVLINTTRYIQKLEKRAK